MNDNVYSFENNFFTSRKWLFSLMLVSAVFSLIAAFVLSVDAVKLAANPNAVFSCDVNSVISCGKVAGTWQASLFGFPNSFLGLITEPIVITIAVAGLAGSNFKPWFTLVAQFFYLLGLIFALWLFYQSAFVIHAFCPWCLLVTVGTSITFFTLLRFNIVNGNFGEGKLQNILSTVVRLSLDTVLEIVLIISIVSIIVVNYGSQLFG